MTDTEKRQAAKRFAQQWAGQGDEKQQTQAFWTALLRNVFGVAAPEDYIRFEMPVRVKIKYKGKITTKFIDAYIPATKVLIEQKSCGVDLFKEERQSNGQMFTAFDQAQNYANHLSLSIKPRWIITCNFQEFYIYDCEQPAADPVRVALADLADEYHQLDILINKEEDVIHTEERVSKGAGSIVRELYETLIEQYYDPADPKALESLNTLCVRLVFCFYADSAGIFEANQFRSYLARRRDTARQALIDLFAILDTKENRDPYLDEDLLAFPYVNGGLFSKQQDITIPRISGEIVDLILHQAYSGFRWAEINPPVFGSIFESTLNPETRHDLGMHYTTVRDIHRVIDPLFLDALRQEFFQIVSIPVPQARRKHLIAFQDKLASLKFLDPACGSGNFLTETYLSLRKLENEVISELQHNQYVIDDTENPVKVSISQFYGIEINDFAVSVAKAALWIAESQMLQQTMDIVHRDLDFLPLKTNAHIVKGNALRLDWESVVPKSELSYIMGNPPFVGQQIRKKTQSDDMSYVFGKGTPETKLDYVTCWYKKTLDVMNAAGQSRIKAAFVSTNSICQGESVPTFWKRMSDTGIDIIFAHKSFKWSSESSNTAAVVCVIVGFTNGAYQGDKFLFEDGKAQKVPHINAYLLNAPDIWITSRKNIPPNGLPKMVKGSEPTDGGNLFLDEAAKAALEEKYPQLTKYIRPFVGGDEYLSSKLGTYTRYCLWFVHGNPSDYARIPEMKARFTAIAKKRAESRADRIRKSAEYPYLFCQIRQPETSYLLFPRHSSNERDYIPIGYISSDVIAGDACYIIPDAPLFLFGLLTSNVHMTWMRLVCGRLGNGYRYSPAVYNNFPIPALSEEQKVRISQTAQAILDARAKYPDSILADLYGPAMPLELTRAHQANDRAVWDAYGRAWPVGSESACVAHLMELYQTLTA